MKRVIIAMSGALAGIILFQFLFYKCERRALQKEITETRALLQACIDTPVKIDTLVVRTLLTDTIYLTSTYHVIDTVHDSPAVDWQAGTVQQREYTGVYSHPQFEAHWSALVTGTLDKMTINPPSLIRSLVITKEKTVAAPPVTETVYRERSHLFASMGGWGGSSQGIDAGLVYVRKEGWGLRAGIGTDFEGLTYNAGILIRLR